MAKLSGWLGPQMADPAHHLAQFLRASSSWARSADFHLNVNAGIAFNQTDVLPQRNDDPVVEAVAEHGPLFFQHADHLKRLVFNFDAFTQRRIGAKEIGGHVVANDTDRLAALGVRGGQKPALRPRPRRWFADRLRSCQRCPRCWHCDFCISPNRSLSAVGATASARRQLLGQRVRFRERDLGALAHVRPSLHRCR